jgi:putative SOS response-associated peptidase YedK
MELASDVFCFKVADESIFAFAGLWETWKNPAGQLVETWSIITTTPNVLCADVHGRMPVILPDYDYDLWLDPGFQKTDTVCDLLNPFDATRDAVPSRPPRAAWSCGREDNNGVHAHRHSRRY